MTGRCTGGQHHAPTSGGACPCGAVSRHPVAVRDRYAQCADDCTTDCGACKGTGRPPAPDCTRCGWLLASPDELESGLCLRCLNGPPTAPDATAGDGLRELREQLERLASHKIAYVNQEQKWGRSKIVDAVLALPALRDVLAAAARDAEKVRRVEAIAMDLERCAPRELHPVRETAIHLRAALDGTP